MNFYKDADEKKICEDALLVQDACNIGGVLNAYHGIVCRLRELKGWDYPLYSHPAVVLFHDKLEDMLRVPLDERTKDYSKAYSGCKEVIGNE